MLTSEVYQHSCTVLKSYFSTSDSSIYSLPTHPPGRRKLEIMMAFHLCLNTDKLWSLLMVWWQVASFPKNIRTKTLTQIHEYIMFDSMTVWLGMFKMLLSFFGLLSSRFIQDNGDQKVENKIEEVSKFCCLFFFACSLVIFCFALINQLSTLFS